MYTPLVLARARSTTAKVTIAADRAPKGTHVALNAIQLRLQAQRFILVLTDDAPALALSMAKPMLTAAVRANKGFLATATGTRAKHHLSLLLSSSSEQPSSAVRGGVVNDIIDITGFQRPSPGFE